jgi:hypothetical protein
MSDVALDPKYKVDRYNVIRCYTNAEKHRVSPPLRNNAPGSHNKADTTTLGLLSNGGVQSGSRQMFKKENGEGVNKSLKWK